MQSGYLSGTYIFLFVHMWYLSLIEKNLVPGYLLRAGIRKLLKQRLREEKKDNQQEQQAHFMKMVEMLKKGPIAVNTLNANEQHYEVPTSFYEKVLGKNLKYSCGYWEDDNTNFDQAEDNMLELTCERAQLKNGQNILELGCGWGSLSLYMAKKYPECNITGVSNSKTQKEHIDNQIDKYKISNLNIITADINDLQLAGHFDRVLSVEMFEHMRNYQLLLEKIAGFLNDNGKLFVHIFTHKEFTYLFEVKDESDWMSKHFFTGGTMPSDHLLLYFSDHLKIENHWRLSGTHYAKTSEAWLRNMYCNKKYIKDIFINTYGKKNELKWWVYWRIFFMSCSELWKYKNGNEWFISHYLFIKCKNSS